MIKELRELLEIYGPLATIGILLILFSPVVMYSINPTDFDQVKGLLKEFDANHWIGVTFICSGIILLLYRISEKRKEGTISDYDKRLLREEILPTLNREGVSQTDVDHEDLRAQFSALVSIRISLQKAGPKLENEGLRTICKIASDLLSDITEYSPWGVEENIRFDPSKTWEYQRDFDAWCTRRCQEGKRVPAYINGTYYGPMLNLIQIKLISIRKINSSLEFILSKSTQ